MKKTQKQNTTRWNLRNRTFLWAVFSSMVLLSFSKAPAKAGEVVVIDYSTSFEQELTILLNGKEIAKTKLPRSWTGAWIDSVDRADSGLKHGQNKLEVKYRVIKRDPQIPKGTGPNTFKVVVKLQKDQTNAKTAKVVTTIKGPNPIPKVGTSSKKTATFSIR